MGSSQPGGGLGILGDPSILAEAFSRGFQASEENRDLPAPPASPDHW